MSSLQTIRQSLSYTLMGLEVKTWFVHNLWKRVQRKLFHTGKEGKLILGMCKLFHVGLIQNSGTVTFPIIDLKH